MDSVFAPVCRLLAPEFGTFLGVVCAALAGLLVGAMGLGFWRLRARLGATDWRRTAEGQTAVWEGGLLSTWRLYRQLGRIAQDQR